MGYVVECLGNKGKKKNNYRCLLIIFIYINNIKIGFFSFDLVDGG